MPTPAEEVQGSPRKRPEPTAPNLFLFLPNQKKIPKTKAKALTSQRLKKDGTAADKTASDIRSKTRSRAGWTQNNAPPPAATHAQNPRAGTKRRKAPNANALAGTQHVALPRLSMGDGGRSGDGGRNARGCTGSSGERGAVFP